MRDETQYNVHLSCNLCKWGWTCADEGWKMLQWSFVMQLVQMRSNLCKWGVENSKVMHLVQMRSNLYKWGVEHSTIFIRYADCVDDIKLVKMMSNLWRWGVEQYSYMQLVRMRGGTQYNVHLLCNLCKWGRTCADEGWNMVQYSFAMQLVWMRLICAVELRGNIELPWQ